MQKSIFPKKASIPQDKANLLKVFIYADLNKRAERVTSVYGDASAKTPEKRVKDKSSAVFMFQKYGFLLPEQQNINLFLFSFGPFRWFPL